MKIDVAFLPKDTNGIDLSHTVCIVLDIFRATTCIVTAMANGCSRIFPVLTMEDAHVLASQMGSALLAGERQSIKIEGCDIGNSPFEFCQDKVQDKTIIMTTTNGTVAIKSTQGAYCTLIGSFVNAKAVCQKALEYGKDILIVCAGTDGLFSLEDTLCAGLLVQLSQTEDEIQMTDAAIGTLFMYTQAKDKLIETATQSRNGKRLFDLNRLSDINYCLTIDTLDLVPQYKEGKIVVEHR